MSRTLLLTGFEPFGSWKRNVTAEAVAALAGERRHGLTFVSQVLPVAWPRARTVLERALRRCDPAGVVAFGIHSDRRGAFRVETVGANELRFRIADNAGARLLGPIEPAGPSARRTPLPPRAIEAALRAAGVRVRCSRDAGRFLCNAVYYDLLRRGLPAVFVHVPPCGPGEAADETFAAAAAAAAAVARLVAAGVGRERAPRT